MLQGYYLSRSRWLRRLLVSLCLILSVIPISQAQSTGPSLDQLLVELWPEFDRPEVLVIYRAQLSADTALPTQLTFRLPEYVETMHAVATEENGNLFEVDPEAIELRQEGDAILLTFPTSSRNFQFEYYDPVILSKQEQTRQIDYRFTAPYQAEMVTFEVQEPAQTENFSMTPQPSNSFIGSNGLDYNQVDVAGLAPGETFELSATYRRNTAELSVNLLNSGVSEHAADLVAAPEAPTNSSTNLTLGYISVGVGLVLLLGAGGYWWWSERMKQSDTQRRAPRKSRGRASRRRQHASPKKQPKRAAQSESSSTGQLTARFCYNCGAELRSDAHFCHICGAERRSA